MKSSSNNADPHKPSANRQPGSTSMKMVDSKVPRTSRSEGNEIACPSSCLADTVDQHPGLNITGTNIGGESTAPFLAHGFFPSQFPMIIMPGGGFGMFAGQMPQAVYQFPGFPEGFHQSAMSLPIPTVQCQPLMYVAPSLPPQISVPSSVSGNHPFNNIHQQTGMPKASNVHQGGQICLSYGSSIGSIQKITPSPPSYGSIMQSTNGGIQPLVRQYIIHLNL